MSNATRLQKLREQRARSNAVKAAAASSNSSNNNSGIALSTAALLAPNPRDSPSWVKNSCKAEVTSPTKSEVRTNSVDVSKRIGKINSSTMNETNKSDLHVGKRPSREAPTPTQSSRAQKPTEGTKVKNKFGHEPFSGGSTSGPSQPSADKGFLSAKSRFECNPGNSQSTPQVSRLKSSGASATSHEKIHQKETSSGEIPWSSESTSQLKPIVTPPVSRIASNPFMSNDKNLNNASEAKSCNKPVALDRFLSMNNKTQKSPKALKRAESAPFQKGNKGPQSPLKRSVSTNDKNLNNLCEMKKSPNKPVALDRFLSTNGTQKSARVPIIETNRSSDTSGKASRRAESAPIHKSSREPSSPLKRKVSSPSKDTDSSSSSSSSSSSHYVTPIVNRYGSTSPIKRTPKPKSTLQFTGTGSPIWIHAHLLQKSGHYLRQKSGHSNQGWEWIRAFMQDSSSQDSVTVVLADDGRECTVEKRDDLILMGNSWWGTREGESMRKATSPTSVAQFDSMSSDVNCAMPPDDLVELAHLHEPAIVHALRARYEQDLIYTYTGAILLALNPFKKLDHLYTREMMELYWSNNDVGQGLPMNSSTEGGDGTSVEKPPPHVYAMAEKAFSCMLRSLEERDQCKSTADLPPCDQSILVSGESGAGKTVTTKIIMSYLTILSQRRMRSHGTRPGLSVENQVLQSNPVLESFGNARTLRNDNSSRFGKFIEMSFSSSQRDRGTLLGASIHFYLLEKVRLVSVNPGERSYHVFYEVLSSGMSLKDKKRFMLTKNFGRGNRPSTVQDFYMTSISATFDRSRDGVKDSDTYKELRMAMNAVRFDSEEQDGIFSVVASLLHASNLRFVPDPGGGEECLVYDGDGTLGAVANLLGVTEEDLQIALTSSVIEARGERLIKRLSAEQAEKALDALIKATYAGLFAFIVKGINESIELHSSNGGSGVVSTIGVLDIFGFESFDTNSFEQLCINYCNEALQQQFNRFVFKAEQAEYEYEGIEWYNIEFPDNQEALDLIEDRLIGIFSVLDEQCKLPKCTDDTFVRAVYDKCDANVYFEASDIHKSKGTFVVVHYAGRVEYESEGFLFKNKDELPKSTNELLASSAVPLISSLSSIIGASAASNYARHSPKRSSSSAQSSVSNQFASQLMDLRLRISQTGPHYIRCLKPNDILVPDNFEESLIAHQLNCAGVLPAMRIARAGYSMRYTHSSFILRFRSIVSKELPPSKSRYVQKLTSDQLLGVLSDKLKTQMMKKDNGSLDGISDVVSWGVQIGTTKVFLREFAFNALEELRLSTINAAATQLQTRIRAYLCRSRFFLLLGSIITLQCAIRKQLATLRVFRLRCTSKAIIIQKHWRSYFAWSSFQNTLFISIWCQRYWRGHNVRQCFSSLIEYRAAITIQSSWRSYIHRLAHRDVRDAAIIVQCAFRVCKAKRLIRQLQGDAKDVNLIALERDQLRLEMKQMRLELQGRNRSHTGMLGSNICISHDTMSVQSQLQELRQLHQECATKDRELQELREMVDLLHGSKSIPSTLPTTVTISRNGSPSFSSTSRGHTYAQTHRSPNLLDSEIADLDELDCSAISTNGDSFDPYLLPSLHLSSYSNLIESTDLQELPLHSAIKQNNETLFLHEIERTSDVDIEINSTDSSGRTPLHIAVQCANTDLIRLILSHNVIVNTQDFAGNTALHLAESFDIAEILLSNGINPNIPNCDGLCALHLAVKRQDFSFIRSLLSHGADVTTADDICWYTPLHLVAHAETEQKLSLSVRGPIAELLCEAKHPSRPDLNYQDREGNTPLHWAASLAEEDAGILISIFIEHGACPKIVNNRGQTPIHLYCHNNSVRQYAFYHEAFQLMLAKGDPNQQSLSGCTPLHLALYHKDYESARLLVLSGAELNVGWRKPPKWDIFWTDMGSDVVLPLDMVEDLNTLLSIISYISSEQNPARHRGKCMHCKIKFRMLSRKCNCSHCGRSVCGRCSGSLQSSFIPHSRENASSSRDALVKVCILCEAMLLSNSNGVTNVSRSVIHGENHSES